MSVSHEERKAIRQRMSTDMQDGMPVRDAAAKYGYTEAYVRMVARGAL